MAILIDAIIEETLYGVPSISPVEPETGKTNSATGNVSRLAMLSIRETLEGSVYPDNLVRFWGTRTTGIEAAAAYDGWNAILLAILAGKALLDEYDPRLAIHTGKTLTAFEGRTNIIDNEVRRLVVYLALYNALLESRAKGEEHITRSEIKFHIRLLTSQLNQICPLLGLSEALNWVKVSKKKRGDNNCDWMPSYVGFSA